MTSTPLNHINICLVWETGCCEACDAGAFGIREGRSLPCICGPFQVPAAAPGGHRASALVAVRATALRTSVCRGPGSPDLPVQNNDSLLDFTRSNGEPARGEREESGHPKGVPS